MLIREGESCSWRLDLEEGPRTGNDRIGGGLLANGGETGDGQSLVAPGDLSRASVEPAGPDVDLDGFYSDHCHSGSFATGSLARVLRRCNSGNWNACSVLAPSCIERLFDVKGR
jgi:hypothetical protein